MGPHHALGVSRFKILYIYYRIDSFHKHLLSSSSCADTEGDSKARASWGSHAGGRRGGRTTDTQEDTGRAAGNKDEGKSKQEEGVQRWRGRVTKETARLR